MVCVEWGAMRTGCISYCVAGLRAGLRIERGSSLITLSLVEPGLDVKYCQVHTLGDLWGAGGAGEIAGSVSASEARGPKFAR